MFLQRRLITGARGGRAWFERAENCIVTRLEHARRILGDTDARRALLATGLVRGRGEGGKVGSKPGSKPHAEINLLPTEAVLDTNWKSIASRASGNRRGAFHRPRRIRFTARRFSHSVCFLAHHAIGVELKQLFCPTELADC